MARRCLGFACLIVSVGFLAAVHKLLVGPSASSREGRLLWARSSALHLPEPSASEPFTADRDESDSAWGEAGAERLVASACAERCRVLPKRWLLTLLTGSGWVWGLLRDPLLPLLVPLLYPLAPVAWWSVILAWLCQCIGFIALISASTLLATPRFWATLGACRSGPPSRRRLRAAWLVPCPVRVAFALLTEVAFLPALIFLVALERVLVDVCGCTWHAPDVQEETPGSPTTRFVRGRRRSQPQVVLLHGSGVSECQWAAARHLLHLYGLAPVYSVNYLSGPWHADAEDQGVPELAARAAEAIRALSLSADEEVVLVGHSLGGLVAAYLSEHQLCPTMQITRIVAVSSPFVGSALLGWAYRRVPAWLVNRMRADSVLDGWMIPGSPDMEALRARMGQHISVYRFIGGQLDVLVRPDSFLCSRELRISDEHKLLLPHLHHYNIAASPWAWAQVSQWIYEAARDSLGTAYP